MEWGVESSEAVGERERDYASHAYPNLHHRQELMKSTAFKLRPPSVARPQSRPRLISSNSTKIRHWELRCPSTQHAHPPAILDFLYSPGAGQPREYHLRRCRPRQAPKRGRRPRAEFLPVAVIYPLSPLHVLCAASPPRIRFMTYVHGPQAARSNINQHPNASGPSEWN